MIWSAPAKAKRDGALDQLFIQSGVALRLPPRSKLLLLYSWIGFHHNLRDVVLSVQ